MSDDVIRPTPEELAAAGPDAGELDVTNVIQALDRDPQIAYRQILSVLVFFGMIGAVRRENESAAAFDERFRGMVARDLPIYQATTRPMLERRGLVEP